MEFEATLFYASTNIFKEESVCFIEWTISIAIFDG